MSKNNKVFSLKDLSGGAPKPQNGQQPSPPAAEKQPKVIIPPAAPKGAAAVPDEGYPIAVIPRRTLIESGMPGGEASFSLTEMRDILLGMGVRQSHVLVAMRRAERTGEPLAQIMRDFGFLSGEGVATAVSRQTRLDYFPAESVDHINKEHIENIVLTEFNRFVPVGRDENGRLLIAVPDASVVNRATNTFHDQKTRIVIASEHTIQTVFRKYFANSEQAFDAAVDRFTEATRAGRRRGEEDEQAVGLVRDVYFAMLRHACYSGASDLYLHRSEYVGIVRLKVNGVGQIFRTIDISLYDRLLNKLVQDNTKADDLRLRPKEAIVEFSEEDREQYSDLVTRFNFRLELTESRQIRSAVIRILDRNAAATDLAKLGFDDETHKAINRISKTSTGFFLVTGPTGSGKTTSLYAILKSVDAVERSVQSIENPVEYQHGLWLQFEPRKDAGDEGEALNDWLKALLRNAPDVILVGEVRDRAVANICLNAANTGHLVFATLHTNDAVMAMARLKSLQIDLDVLGSVLLGILAQRLLRVLCKDCKVPDRDPETKEAIDEPYLGTVLKKMPFKAGEGCPNCDYTGYRGRRMIYELLQMTPRVREALEKGEPPSVLAKHGMPEDRTMWANGLKLVAEGHTSYEELQRVATRYVV
ncbi:Flp pilus assembly complex ATPase component TadA [Nostoc sp. CHAB 5834]|nr:Flp pilus assembly complex ATPase component TadA [Nostoc sp. CHAB 5834]